MFKRLFISLLILSALASEGVVKFPVNFYNMYLTDINRFDFFVEKQQNIQDKINSEAESSYTYTPHQEAVDHGLFVLSRNTAAYFSKWKLEEPLDYTGDLPIRPSYIFACQTVPFRGTVLNLYDNKDIIFKSSDNSPPQFL